VCCRVYRTLYGSHERGRRKKKKNDDEKKATRKNRRKDPPRDFYLAPFVTDASPGCRSNHSGVAAAAVVAGKMNPRVPYKRPIV
jgi:hypothetical protein